MQPLCPCCNRPLEETLPKTGLSFPNWGPLKTIIIAKLVEAYPVPVTMQQLIDALYSSDPNGGPGNPDESIRMMIWQLRTRMRQYGWTISAGKRYGGWRLQRATAT
jgi:hypothetical protein